jgi:hypothetical protein
MVAAMPKRAANSASPPSSPQWRPVGTNAVLDAGAAKGRAEVGQRLRNAEEHQADTHTSSKQHGKPAGVAVIRCGFGPAEAYPAKWGENQHQTDNHENVGCTDEKPVQIGSQPATKAAEQRFHLALKNQGKQYERDHGKTGDRKDAVVDIQAERAYVDNDVILTDLVVGIDRIHITIGDHGVFIGRHLVCLPQVRFETFTFLVCWIGLYFRKSQPAGCRRLCDALSHKGWTTYVPLAGILPH